MKFLSFLEKKLGPFAVPELTIYLVFAQACGTIMCVVRPDVADRLVLVPAAVLRGEVWRLFTFMFLPPTTSPIWALFALYFLYLMGIALEHNWGEARYNLYVLIAYVATVAAAWVRPDGVGTNAFITGSIFLAFAWLYPEFVIYLFFILPVKVKWLALLTWLGYGVALVTGDGMERAMVLASIANFLLFFGGEIVQRAKAGNRRMRVQSQRLAERDKPFHTCAACGITDKSHPTMEFRYCPHCAGTPGYCIDHIANHTHR